MKIIANLCSLAILISCTPHAETQKSIPDINAEPSPSLAKLGASTGDECQDTIGQVFEMIKGETIMKNDILDRGIALMKALGEGKIPSDPKKIKDMQEMLKLTTGAFERMRERNPGKLIEEMEPLLRQACDPKAR